MHEGSIKQHFHLPSEDKENQEAQACRVPEQEIVKSHLLQKQKEYKK